MNEVAQYVLQTVWGLQEPEEQCVIGVEVGCFLGKPKHLKKVLKVLRELEYKVVLFSDLSEEEEENVLDAIDASRYTVIHSHYAAITATTLKIKVDFWIVKGSNTTDH